MTSIHIVICSFLLFLSNLFSCHYLIPSNKYGKIEDEKIFLNFIQLQNNTSHAKKIYEFIDQFSVKCIWIDNNFNIFDLSDLQKKNNESDHVLNLNSREKIYVSFCENLKFDCGSNKFSDSQMIYEYIVDKGFCKKLAGSGNNYNKWELINATNPFEGINITLNFGETCREQGSNYDTFYSVDLIMRCDYNNITKSTIEFDRDSLDAFDIIKCKNTLSAVSKSACPALNIYMLSKFIERYKVIFGIIAILLGFFFILFGNKFLKVTVIFVLIILSITMVLYVYYYLPIDRSKDYTLWISVAVGGLLGLIIGYFIVKIEALIYFGIGAYLGYIIGNGVYAAFVVNLNNSIYSFIICLVICMIIFGYISYKLSKHVIIISTSIIGGYMIVRGGSFYLGHFPNESVIFDLIKNHEFEQLQNKFDGFFIIYVVALLVFIISGIYIQYKFHKDKVQDENNGNYRRV